jgi:hypothetical protein
MIHTRLVLVAALMALVLFALPVTSHAEERFGPWVYYAPYYFPPDKCCLGHCFGPDDFLPRYESPNPPEPPNNVPPPMPRPPRQSVRKVSAADMPVPHAQLEPAPAVVGQTVSRSVSPGSSGNGPNSAAQTVSRSGNSGPNKPVTPPRAGNAVQPRPVQPPAPGSQGSSM